jgi:small subunit ribosomal protein S1
VSHIRTHEEYEGTSRAPKKSSSSKSNLKSVNSNAEKSTLGDLDALAELKEKMDKKK